MADVILLLFSPDFIASEYCYGREMKRALARHGRGEARVISVILHPCDWHGLEFGTPMATPKDGRAITKWSNIDEAFLDVVLAIKMSLDDLGRKPVATAPSQGAAERQLTGLQPASRSSNLRIKKQFTDLNKDRFRQRL